MKTSCSTQHIFKQYSGNVYDKAMKFVEMGIECGHREVKCAVYRLEPEFSIVSELNFRSFTSETMSAWINL